MNQIDIQNALQLQSRYLYCQAAGSDGSDKTKPGVHLRWDLMKELGEQHIPKGNLCEPGTGFNKSDDFVGIFRAPYTTDGQIVIDFANLNFQNVSLLPEDHGIIYSHGADNIHVRFGNRPLFRKILNQGLDPINPVQDFLDQYKGGIEVEVEGKILFFYSILFPEDGASNGLGLATICTKDRMDDNALMIMRREEIYFDEFTSTYTETFGENIKYIRAAQSGIPAPLQIVLHTYEDLFESLQNNGMWEPLGNFSLSDDDQQVFSWFQGTPYNGGNLDLTWPKYDNGVMLVPDNYMDRWLNSDDGLKKTVLQFLQLSQTDPKANVPLPSADPEDPNGITVSLLDMLRLVSLDYHGARMMGLGCLDEYPEHEPETKYVYAAVYRTEKELPGMGLYNDHVYLTLPTSTYDLRLPVPPLLHPVTYGLSVQTDEGNEPQRLSDENGYSLWDDVRFINLSKTNVNGPEPMIDTTPGTEFFDATRVTQPAGFVIKYKRIDESEWRRPELLSEDEYLGSDGNRESLTTPEREESPIYTHREAEEGMHEYALCAVNWFSRASKISNIVATDKTVFPKRNRLLPPFNMAVQYIQEEDPLIFTTQTEQDELAAALANNPDGDYCKTRVNFDWNQLHNNAYQAAKKIEFFFRDTPLKKVEGKIRLVESLPGGLCRIMTTSLPMISTNPATTIVPQIAPAEQSRFIGSMLTTEHGQFEIVSIGQPWIAGDGPIFLVKKLASNEMVQPGADEPMVNVTSYTEPKADTVFFVFEKVAVTNGWTKLAQTVDLVNFSNATELITEDDGSTHTEIVGGINASAVVEEIQGSGGGYRITFPHGVDLAPHSDPAVTWNKGSARFTVAAAPHLKRQLPVVAIEQTIPIKIVVFDPEYLASPANRIQVGPTVPVNFHPSYRVYLSPQAGVFDKTKVLPQGTQNNRKTYLAARSADTTVPFYSPLTPPSILVAKNIQKPLAPDSVQGPRFATRPDFYGKATYTFDVPLNTANRTPFGLVVYRANEMAILQALYKPVTMGQVMADLESIAGNDPLRFNRWRSLIECEVDPDDNNRFKPFDNYRFPNPDNESTEVFASASTSVHPFPLPAGETLLSKKAIILKVIEDAFMPLTETPLVFEYLKTGYQTSPTPPTTRSVIGRLLHATDASFDPFPMAVKFPQGNPHTVRFTDYSLNGNSRNIYFYFAREVSVTARYSDRTPVSEAVVLVDAAPAEKPVVRRVATREANPVSNQGPAIEFDLGEYLDSENIRQYQIFRTTEAAAASSVRSMTLAATIDAGNSVEDVFSDLAYPPYSEPLFYRIVALREIVNEQGALEMIPSQPSEILLTNVIDSLNPEAPEIVPTIGGTVTNSNGRVTALTNVSLSWPQSVYNGTYHLYKMNSKGNWERLWSKKTNDGQISFPENGDFAAWPQTANLQTLDGEGNPIYHRFKVSVENANGLFNVDEKELILPVENAISSTEFVTGITSVGVVRNDFENWVGFAFNVSFPLTVNCLGRFKLTGNSQTHEVRIIRESDGVVMCSALVDMSTGPVGQFVYATCIPTTLTAGVTYYCVSFEYNNGDYWYDNNGTSMNVQAIGGLLGSVYFQNSWIYNGNQTYVPPGFMYQ